MKALHTIMLAVALSTPITTQAYVGTFKPPVTKSQSVVATAVALAWLDIYTKRGNKKFNKIKTAKQLQVFVVGSPFCKLVSGGSHVKIMHVDMQGSLSMIDTTSPKLSKTGVTKVKHIVLQKCASIRNAPQMPYNSIVGDIIRYIFGV